MSLHLRRLHQVGLCIALIFSTLSCATAMRSPLTGILYSDVQSGHSLTSNQTGTKVGEACASSILGLIATGDASIEAARRNGGITQITSVDEHSENIFVFYAKHCTVVRGR